MALINLIDMYGSPARAEGDVALKSTKRASSQPNSKVETVKLSAPVDVVSISSSAERSTSVKPNDSKLPRAYLRYQRELNPAKRNFAIAAGVTAALSVSIFFAPPLAAVYLLYSVILSCVPLLITGANWSDKFYALATRIGKLDPQAQKDALEQIYEVDPDLADRLGDRIEEDKNRLKNKLDK